MGRSTILFLALAVGAAAVCVRLGFWQLDRREERRERNALIASRMTAAPTPLASLSGDDTVNRYRQVRVSGRPDFAREFLLTLRGNRGSPGVDIITPVRVPGSDSAILVNRGWIYSPDGMTADLARWREPDTMFTGYVEAFDTSGLPDSVRRNGIRRMDYEAIARTLPYPIRQFYLVVTSPPTVESSSPIARIGMPKLDDGPHTSYAFQWFAFGTIALIGGGIVAARSMRT
jgi:surfeit locus 1 family protein